MSVQLIQERRARLARLGVGGLPRAKEQPPRLEPPPAPIKRDWLLLASQGEYVAPRTLIRAVAEIYGVDYHEILGHRRLKALGPARRDAVALVKKHFPLLSLPQIGRIFNRDHTTILHSLRKQLVPSPRICPLESATADNGRL